MAESYLSLHVACVATINTCQNGLYCRRSQGTFVFSFCLVTFRFRHTLYCLFVRVLAFEGISDYGYVLFPGYNGCFYFIIVWNNYLFVLFLLQVCFAWLVGVSSYGDE